MYSIEAVDLFLHRVHLGLQGGDFCIHSGDFGLPGMLPGFLSEVFKEKC